MTQPPAMDGKGGARPTDQALVASDEAGSRLHPLGFDPSRILREIFPRAYHYWRNDTIGAQWKDGSDSYIPFRCDDLLEAIVTEFERATAIATEARRAETLGSVHEGAGPKDIAQDDALGDQP